MPDLAWHGEGRNDRLRNVAKIKSQKTKKKYEDCAAYFFSCREWFQLASNVLRDARMEAISPTPLMERKRKDFFSEAAFL